MVELKDLQRKELREASISIRTFPSYTKWLKKNKVSPSILFNKAVEELMGSENNSEKNVKEDIGEDPLKTDFSPNFTDL